MTPGVPVTSAASDGAAPVGISVAVNPVLDQVVIQFGEQAIGLPRHQAMWFTQHVMAAIEQLNAMNARQVKQ